MRKAKPLSLPEIDGGFMKFSRLIRNKIVWLVTALAAAALFFACNTTSPEDKFEIVADSAWVDFDRLVVVRISDGDKRPPDTLFDKKLNSIQDLKALPAGDYHGGRVTFTLQGFVGDTLVLNQGRVFDGATGKTEVTTTIDFSHPPDSVAVSLDTVRVGLGLQSLVFSGSVFPSKSRQGLIWRAVGGVCYLVYQNGDLGASVKVYGQSAGMGKVIAQAKDDTTKADTAVVIVTDTVKVVDPDTVLFGSVTLSPDSIQLSGNGATFSLQATVIPAGAKLSFSSRDSSVATVDSLGKVTSHKAGVTRIVVVSAKGLSDSSVVVVVPVVAVPSVMLLPDSIQLKENRQVFVLQTVVVPSGAKLTFLSRDTSVATVDSVGRVLSRKLGKTRVVVVTEDGVSDSSVVEVIQEMVPLASVRISPDSMRLKEGGKVDSFQILRSSDLPTAKVTFQSLDTSVVRVDSLGRIRTGKPGKTRIVASIEDGDPDSSLIEVVANVRPVIQTFAPTASISIRDTVAFNLSAYDPDGVIHFILWRLTRDTSVIVKDTVDKSSLQKSRSQMFPDTGTFKARVTVVDEDGAVAKDSVTVRVVLDPPVVNAGRDTVGKPGESLVFTGLATQVYGRIVMWKWDFDGNGTWDDSSATSPTLSHAYFKEARYSATLYARDDDGNVATDFRLIDITSNALVLFGLTPRDTVISIKDSVTFNAQSIDTGGTVRLIAWDYDGDGAQDDTLNVNEASLSFRGGHRYATAGVYRIILKVTDNLGRIAKDTARVTVKLDPPKANAGADTTVFTGTKVTLHTTATDTLGIITKKEWSISGAPFKRTLQADTSFTVTNDTSHIACILMVTDDDGNTASDTVIIAVALHRETRLDSLSLSAGKLSPTFNSDTLSYRDTVGLAITSVRLTATLRDATASMKLKGKALPSGIASDTLALNMGLNSFQIAIVAQDTAFKKTYTVNVVRVDDVPPLAPTVSVLVQDSTQAKPNWTWVPGGGGMGAYRYKLDDSILTVGATTVNATGFKPLTNLSDGYHTLYVQERDSAGNWSPIGNARALVSINPLSWYNLDGNGSDSGLNHANATVTKQAVWATDNNGKLGGALEFDGATDSLITGKAKYATGAQLTVSFWFLNSGKGGHAIFMFGEDANIAVFTDTTSIGLAISNPSSNFASGTFLPNTWTHFIGTYDGATIRAYINGKLATSLAWVEPGLKGSLTRFKIGVRDGMNWAGTLDDLRIYGRVVAASEFSKIMADNK
jgi:hypothetical protein